MKPRRKELGTANSIGAKVVALRKKRGRASPGDDFFLSYHIPKENARGFFASGDFFAGRRPGRRGEGKKVKLLRYWGTNQGSGPSENSCFQTDISLYPLQSTSNPTQINEKERASPQTPAISRILGIVILR